MKLLTAPGAFDSLRIDAADSGRRGERFRDVLHCRAMKMFKSGVLALAILLCISHSEAKSTSGMDVLHQCKEVQSGNANFADVMR